MMVNNGKETSKKLRSLYKLGLLNYNVTEKKERKLKLWGRIAGYFTKAQLITI